MVDMMGQTTMYQHGYGNYNNIYGYNAQDFGAIYGYNSTASPASEVGLLGTKFREAVSKSKDYKMKVETEANVGYSTGFLAFDFLNGQVIHVMAPDRQYKYYSVGIVDGSMNMLIGRSGCGKTSFAMQIGTNICGMYRTSTMFHDDIEGGMTEARKAILSGWTQEQLQYKYICRNTGITAENFYERIKLISDLKLNDRASYLYDTGLYDSFGQKIFKLEPTVYLLDSLSLMMPETYTEEDEISGQMSTTATARMNASVFRRVVPLLKSANIILLVINHINQKVEINMFKKTRLQVGFLKEGETLPGGNMPIYLSNNIIRFDDSNIKEKDGLGIDGYLVDLTLVKSRQNKAGKSVTLVFNQSTGYDPDLSLLLLLKENKLINGAGAYLYIGDRADYKFSQKEFKKKLMTDDEFKKIVIAASIPILQQLVYDVQQEPLLGHSGVSQSILEQMNQLDMAA